MDSHTEFDHSTSKQRVLSFHVCSPTIETPEDFIVEVPESSSIFGLKTAIYDIHPLKPLASEIRLIFRGKLLADNDSVNSLCNYSESNSSPVIHMVVNPNSCAITKPVKIESPILTDSKIFNSTVETDRRVADSIPSYEDLRDKKDFSSKVPDTPKDEVDNQSANPLDSGLLTSAKPLSPIYQYLFINGQAYLAVWPSSPSERSSIPYPVPLYSDLGQFTTPRFAQNYDRIYRGLNYVSILDPYVERPLSTGFSEFSPEDRQIVDEILQRNNLSFPTPNDSTFIIRDSNNSVPQLNRNQNVNFFNRNGMLSRIFTRVRSFMSSLTISSVGLYLWTVFKFGLIYLLFLQGTKLSNVLMLLLIILGINLMNTDYVRNLLNNYNRAQNPNSGRNREAQNINRVEEPNAGGDNGIIPDFNGEAQNVQNVAIENNRVGAFSRLQALLFAFLISIFPVAPLNQPVAE
ncbi:hypothetical protein AYI68_g3623 [Smittium mucronatum]|uniref:Ubiquitin-like domain-containing protein n=1 Tax=Smittium mucronatum TaxID=133383 RepID=A0A1R0GZG6_9FUNG|nr:hypothetical protein AYI68_g5441 [Smittium mucronatum]OLY82255.1 hypothetical protein AYI68_g3623 [Smittium mucronatum]